MLRTGKGEGVGIQEAVWSYFQTFSFPHLNVQSKSLAHLRVSMCSEAHGSDAAKSQQKEIINYSL